MNSDRELLELAAKAAGIELEWDSRGAYEVIPGVSGNEKSWSPLTDGGDTLRLIATLGGKYQCVVFGIFANGVLPYVSASVVHSGGNETYAQQDIEDDLEAAMRRAAVRVASEIGRAMS